MCLLVALSNVVEGSPLVVAANRDELLARPARSMTVLASEPIQILGGRDELAGGTWAAVNLRGVVAALTNQPGRRQPGRRSRGELPLLAARWPSAEAAVTELEAAVRPGDYSPCWMLVGDREALWYLAVDEGRHPEARRLPPGLFVLENAPLDAATPKARHVADGVREAAQSASTLEERLAGVLASHRPPADPDGRPDVLQAACVHAGPYGTRSALIVVVDGAGSPPKMLYTDGPPCTAPWQEATQLWQNRARR